MAARTKKGPNTVVIACRVLEDMFRRHPGDGKALFLEYGLHRTPQKLAPTLQEEIDRIPSPSVVLLGYGLCGNGLVGLRAGEHKLVIPRVDDCISILLGSRQRYLEETSRQPGTYYLSKGWLERATDPLKEYQSYLQKYDPETARWLIDTQYGNYQRLLFVAAEEADFTGYGPYARRVAEFCGLEYQECMGVDTVVRSLLAQAVQPQPGPDFVVVPPGGVVEASVFLD
ncbi:MAG: DUF1638 domain-containing protein [Dehalococcoidia bacterium]|nr:DUF1638 domain-containing protein [Dehalococcoidia bacterium]